MPTFDTYIDLIPEDEQQLTRKTFRYGFRRHIAVKGFQKLINKWVKCFLTLKGTDLSDREYGTLFSQLIGSNVTSRRDIVEAVQISVEECNDVIFRLQSARLSDDPAELLDDAELTALTVTPDGTGFEAFVRIRNQAKQTLSVQIPTTTTEA